MSPKLCVKFGIGWELTNTYNATNRQTQLIYMLATFSVNLFYSQSIACFVCYSFCSSDSD